MTGSTYGLNLFITNLYGRPHESSLREEINSFQALALDLLMAARKESRASRYFLYASSVLPAIPLLLDLAYCLRKWTEVRRNSAISSVHQYSARLGKGRLRGIDALHASIMMSRSRAASSLTLPPPPRFVLCPCSRQDCSHQAILV